MLKARWTVKALEQNKTEVLLSFEVDFKNKLVGWLIYPLLKIKYVKVCEQLLDNWQAKLLGKPGFAH